VEPIDPTERLLTETPVPLVVEGVHREQLKQRLLAHAQSAQPRRKEMIKFAGRFSTARSEGRRQRTRHFSRDFGGS
jgi:hypothetical protein